ncbi:MAG: hypothetical protein FWC27_04525 [Firmicutes bacterium]|nr:hypothetical protein [Bacillota bacterium]
MKLAKNRKTLTVIAIVLALVIAASATFAWITSKNQIANEFKNEGFANGNGLVAIEPEKEFKLVIGEKTDKHVSVLNTGESGMLARVSFEEMNKLLSLTNTVQYHNAITDAAANQIAIPFNNSTAALTGWSSYTGPIAPALPSGVTLYTKTGGTTTNPVPMFKAMYEYGTPTQYQLVKFDGKATIDATGAVTGITDATYAYGFYTEGTAVYNSWNGQHNYAPWNAVTPFGTTTPALIDIGKSTVNATDITLHYSSDLITATPTPDKWFYFDGYFYYIGVLDGGQATPYLLEQVGLNADVNQDIWQKYEYTLVVCVEGLQANKDAVTDTSSYSNPTAAGWGLSDATLVGALNDAIDAYNA